MKRFAILLGLLGLYILSCYHGHGLSSTEPISGIEGRITFMGTWPDSTKEIRVIVLKEYAQGITDMLQLMQFVQENYVTASDTIPRSSRQYDYKINLQPGEYGWVLVAWFPNIDFYFLGVKELGAYYENPDDSDLPTTVSVIEDRMTVGIDIIADFANVNRDWPFFKRMEARDEN